MKTLQTLGCRLCLLLVMQVASLSAAENSQPNVILIMADDFGYECLTANGGQSYQTPHLDTLAATGVRFDHCHVQPLCTPTRVQLMTGRYNVRNYLNFGTLVRSETTFGHLFKAAGYATGVCGKWQLGREVDSPQHFGFEESCLWQHTRRPPRYANPGLEYNGVEKDFDEGKYGPALVNDFALDFIARHRDRRFFLYYPMMLTHDPFQPTPDSKNWDPKIKSENAQKNVKHFADMTAYMDKLIGQLVFRLEELGLRENTLLIFLGDNGTLGSIHSQFKESSFKGGKGQTTHRGTHVPCIANWPAVISRGSVCSDLISSTDFLPSLCEAAGLSVPDGVDGISFVPQLRGERGTPREWLYSWYSPRQQADMGIRESVFDRNFKLYRTGELFDLRIDPDEKHPLQSGVSDENAVSAVKKLGAVLEQFRDARPPELDEQFLKSVVRDPAKPADPQQKSAGKKQKRGQ